MGGLPANVAGFAEGLGNSLSELRNVITGITSSLAASSPAGVLSGLKDVGSALAGNFTAIAGVTQDLITQSTAFVAALNPAVIQLFNYTLSNLMATIGTGLLPVFTVFTGVIEKISGILQPIFTQLAPIIQAIAETLGGVWLTALRSIVQLFDIFKPVLEVLIGIWQVAEVIFQSLYAAINIILSPLQILARIISAILAPFFEAFQSLIRVFNDVITVLQVFIKVAVDSIVAMVTAIFGGADLKSALDNLVSGIKGIVKEIIRIAAQLGSLIYGPEFIERLIRGLGPQPHALAAPQGIHISSFEDIAKKLEQASVIAGSGSTAQSSEEFLKEIRDMLSSIRDTDGLFQDLADKIGRAVVNAMTFGALGAESRVIHNLLGIPGGQ